jgi:competence protein ComEC
MAIVFGIFFTVLRAAGLPRWASGAILAPLIWFYVALTGWPASAIRASIMLSIMLLGWVLKRPGNSLNSLFAAALLILVWQPQQLFQAGFQLSFFVVLCLILTVPPFIGLLKKITAPDPLSLPQLQHRRSRWLAVPGCYLGDIWVTSFAAWIGSLPLVAYYFNIITPVSTPANLVAVPLCVLVLISNLISLVLAGWVPAAAELFNHAGWFGMECIRVSSQWFANWPAAYLYTSAPRLFTIFLYYGILLGVATGWLFRPTLRPLKLAGAGAAMLIWIWMFWQDATSAKLSVLPVNGGISIYSDSPGRLRDLLIDTGPSNAVQFITKNFLRAQGVNRLPALLLSHGDVHHTSGAETIVDLFKVPLVYTSPIRFRSAGYRSTVEHLGMIPGLLQTVKSGESLRDWTILHPDAGDHFPKADDGAVVLLAQLRRTRVLLLSDLGPAGQTALLQRNPDLRAEIVVAGLPGTGEPLGEALLQAVQPKLIIVADSEFPFSERAKPALRARLRRQRAPVLYTSETGAVTLEFRENKWRLRTISGRTLQSKDLTGLAP